MFQCLRSYLDEKIGWEDLSIEDAFEITQGDHQLPQWLTIFVNFPQKCVKIHYYNHVTCPCSEIQEDATKLGAGGLALNPPIKTSSEQLPKHCFMNLWFCLDIYRTNFATTCVYSIPGSQPPFKKWCLTLDDDKPLEKMVKLATTNLKK